MKNAGTEKTKAVLHNQNVLLYSAVKFSVVGSVLAALLLLWSLFSKVDMSSASQWLAALLLICALRLYDQRLFKNDPHAQQRPVHWSRRFYAGALLSSCAWASVVWLMFPDQHPAYQVLLVLTLGGVAGGALASLAYDNRLSLSFLAIILVSVQAKFLAIGSSFAYELAIYSLLVFAFLFICGAKIGASYIELLALREESQENHLALIETTEEMAHMGYWHWTIDRQNEQVDLSENLARMLGIASREASYEVYLDRVHPDDLAIIKHSLKLVMNNLNGWDQAIEYRIKLDQQGEYRYMRQLTRRIHGSDGKDSLLGSVQDVSDSKKAELKIHQMAYYDSLTGLANRAHFHEQLNKVTCESQEHDQRYALMFIDLDSFKGVNDSFGHESGDLYLCAFAEHLRAGLGTGDIAARLGGDEFCVLIPALSSDEQLDRMVAHCFEFTRHSISLGAHRIDPGLSLGIATYPEHGDSAERILKSADLAMYAVKQTGRMSVAYYDESMEDDVRERMRFEADLRQALKDDDFELWYQPKICTREHCITGVEALIRWNHPEKGLVPPDQFINTAERVGLIDEIGNWVFGRACWQLRQWNEADLFPDMAVNISGSHFTSDGFVDMVKQTIGDHAVQAGDIEIEITESLSRDPQAHMTICSELRAAGIRVAIDDFGTGYSSLSVLSTMEVDTLKIDRSFVQHLTQDPASQLMVKTIVELALGLGFSCVAEGVETEEQLAFLRQLNCPKVQGYLFSKPVKSAVMFEMLQADHSKRAAA